MSLDLVDAGQIAQILRCSRQHVVDRVTKLAGFPRPAVNLSRKTRSWDRDDVMSFLRAPTAKSGRRRAA